LATRELMRHFLFHRTETDLHQNFGEACAHFCTIAPASSFHYEMKVFTDSSIVEELKVLEDDPEFSPQERHLRTAQSADRISTDLNVSQSEREVGVERLEQG